jgi:outer membrane protein OmpA-like peptidoglycan-associated protein
MSFSVLSRRVAALAVAGTGLAVVMSGAFAPANAATTSATRVVTAAKADSSWFVDPRTPAQRRAEVAVPRKPKAYAGKRRETVAVYRTRGGKLAVPMATAFGHQLAQGQAVTLAFKTAKLSAPLRAQLTRLAASLDNASSIRCEGHADYADPAASTRKRSGIRAAAVCDLLAAKVPGLKATSTSYGAAWPAVVGGKPANRALNRRVTVEMTGTRRATQPEVKVPGAPTLVSAYGYTNRVSYSFEAPAVDGGAPITSYQVNTGDGWKPVVLDTLGASRKTAAGECLDSCPVRIFAVVTGFEAGDEVTLRVRALNRVGAGAPSNALSASVLGYPSAPADLTVVGGDSTITTTFSAPESDGGTPVLGYDISYDGGQTWEPVPADTWTVVKTGLDNGTVYDVAVRAYNAHGYSELATGSDLVATVPDRPWLEEDVVTDGTSAELTFTSPQLDDGTDGGADITGYEITFDGGLTWDAFDYTEDANDEGVYHATLSDLTLGDLYKVAVRAVNERGAGASSKTRTFTPAIAPGAPTDVVATVDGTSVTVDFDAPAFDGGAEITGYEVSVDDGDWAAVELDSSAYSFTLAGQAVGPHTYAVRAVNRIGASTAGTSNEVTVVATAQPDAPTIGGYGYYGAGQQWVASFTPGNDNGATVTGWQVSVGGGAWVSADQVVSGTPMSAYFNCPGMACGWTYGSSIRLRAVTATGYSEASLPYASNPI